MKKYFTVFVVLTLLLLCSCQEDIPIPSESTSRETTMEKETLMEITVETTEAISTEASTNYSGITTTPEPSNEYPPWREQFEQEASPEKATSDKA